MKSKDWVCLVTTEAGKSLATYDPTQNAWYRYTNGHWLRGEIQAYVSLSSAHWHDTEYSHGDRLVQTNTECYPTNAFALCVVQLESGRLTVAQHIETGWVDIISYRPLREKVERFILIGDLDAEISSV